MSKPSADESKDKLFHFRKTTSNNDNTTETNHNMNGGGCSPASTTTTRSSTTTPSSSSSSPMMDASSTRSVPNSNSGGSDILNEKERWANRSSQKKKERYRTNTTTSEPIARREQNEQQEQESPLAVKQRWESRRANLPSNNKKKSSAKSRNRSSNSPWDAEVGFQWEPHRNHYEEYVTATNDRNDYRNEEPIPTTPLSAPVTAAVSPLSLEEQYQNIRVEEEEDYELNPQLIEAQVVTEEVTEHERTRIEKEIRDQVIRESVHSFAIPVRSSTQQQRRRKLVCYISSTILVILLIIFLVIFFFVVNQQGQNNNSNNGNLFNTDNKNSTTTTIDDFNPVLTSPTAPPSLQTTFLYPPTTTIVDGNEQPQPSSSPLSLAPTLSPSGIVCQEPTAAPTYYMEDSQQQQLDDNTMGTTTEEIDFLQVNPIPIYIGCPALTLSFDNNNVPTQLMTAGGDCHSGIAFTGKGYWFTFYGTGELVTLTTCVPGEQQKFSTTNDRAMINVYRSDGSQYPPCETSVIYSDCTTNHNSDEFATTSTNTRTTGTSASWVSIVGVKYDIVITHYPYVIYFGGQVSLQIFSNNVCNGAFGPIQLDRTISGLTAQLPTSPALAPTVTNNNNVNLNCGYAVNNIKYEDGTTVPLPGLWYKVRGTGKTMIASTCDSISPLVDTQISVFRSSDGSISTNGEVVGTNDEFCSDDLHCITGSDNVCGLHSLVVWSSMRFVDYYLYVTAISTSQTNPKNGGGITDFDYANVASAVEIDAGGYFFLKAEEAAVPNDGCGTAIGPLQRNTNVTFSLNGATVDIPARVATTNTDTPSCFRGFGTQYSNVPCIGVWYTIVGDGTVLSIEYLDTNNHDNDNDPSTYLLPLFISVYSGDSCYDLVCKIETTYSGTNVISWPSIWNEKYYIFVHEKDHTATLDGMLVVY